jgi:hypothetical protein
MSNNNVTTGVTFSFGGNTVNTELDTGYGFFCDTYISASTLMTITLTANTDVVLYTSSITPGTYNVLQLKTVLSFTHTKVVSSDISFAL